MSADPTRWPDRPWTGKERDRLRQMRREGRTYAECGAALGRSKGCCNAMANRCGMTRPLKHRTDQRRRLLPRLHAQGLTCWQMAKRHPALGGHSLWYRDHGVLGLVPHALPKADRARRALAACKRKHGQYPGQFRMERHRSAAVLSGWPAASKGAVVHLDAFYRLGPATQAEHSARMGRGPRNWAAYALFRAGHLVAVGRKGRRRVFDLAPGVRARRTQYLAYRSAA